MKSNIDWLQHVKRFSKNARFAIIVNMGMGSASWCSSVAPTTCMHCYLLTKKEFVENVCGGRWKKMTMAISSKNPESAHLCCLVLNSSLVFFFFLSIDWSLLATRRHNPFKIKLQPCLNSSQSFYKERPPKGPYICFFLWSCCSQVLILKNLIHKTKW